MKHKKLLSFTDILRSIYVIIYQTAKAMLNFKRSFFVVFILGILGAYPLIAQPQLERISITKRGDGNGYVLRYHLTEMVDSYDLIQPEINRVQMQLFSPGLDTDGVQMPESNEEILNVELIALEGGIGIDITTAQNIFLIAEAYPDQNMRHLLVNFEYATQADLEAITPESNLYEWSAEETAPDANRTDTIVEEEPETPEQTGQSDMQPETEQEDQQRTVQREPVTVKIGVSGGIGMANKLGGNYTGESRQEFLMGISAGISLPFVLPYSIKTGIETGVFFTQKGFLNPSADRFNGETVVLDYVEIPVLARVRYDFTDAIKPKVVGGFYTAFRANAEVIESNGDRDDLSEVTKPIDFGLVAGVGTDFLVASTDISFQIQYGVGIPPLFTGNFSGNERLGYFSLLFGIKF